MERSRGGYTPRLGQGSEGLSANPAVNEPLTSLHSVFSSPKWGQYHLHYWLATRMLNICLYVKATSTRLVFTGPVPR